MATNTMRTRGTTVLGLVFFLALCILSCSGQQHTFAASSSSPRSSLRLGAISRTVDLGGATSKATTIYSLKPPSPSPGDDAAQVFVFAIDARDAANLSWVEAYTGRTGNTKKPVKIEALDQPTDG